MMPLLSSDVTNSSSLRFTDCPVVVSTTSGSLCSGNAFTYNARNSSITSTAGSSCRRFAPSSLSSGLGLLAEEEHAEHNEASAIALLEPSETFRGIEVNRLLCLLLFLGMGECCGGLSSCLCRNLGA